ncbi:MAG: ATP-dependent sacrificial sulfur transferase LarE [Clostridium perfringens]|nr:ATP-dependent sacrificial sulfur transferase LarE [Clostridium perfringens]
MNKLESLKDYIKNLGKVALAFSGGVDSTFLLKVCSDVLGKDAVAITIVSPYMPTWEMEEAKELTKKFNIRHEFVEVGIPENIKYNPADRCYLCKKQVFTLVKNKAEEFGIKYLIDGTNLDDTKDYRPGMMALKELQVKSPLLDLGFTKADIRMYSKELNLETWSKPAYACLLTRLQVGDEITEEKVRRIENSERFMFSLGLTGIRVRSHGDLARIEVQPNDREKLFNTEILDKISNKLKEFGFNYVTLDMGGYKMGSLNKEK